MKRLNAALAAIAGLTLATVVPGQDAPQARPPVPGQSRFPQISAQSLQESVAYLASDELEGRATPSKGLDLAAEFLAGKFRQAGLEPIGPGGTFYQEARFGQITPNMSKLSVKLVAGEQQIQLEPDTASIRTLTAINRVDSPVISLPEDGDLPEVKGKVVAGASSVYGTEAGMKRLQAEHPGLILLVSPLPASPGKGRNTRSYLEDLDADLAPVVRVGNEETLTALTSGQSLTLSIHAEAPKVEVLKLRNVGGLLRGSDPAFRDQYLILTAHYDHVGKRTGSGDQIFNGANDNASGTASVVEIARALAALPTPPPEKRVISDFVWRRKGPAGRVLLHPASAFPALEDRGRGESGANGTHRRQGRDTPSGNVLHRPVIFRSARTYGQCCESRGH